MPSLLGADKILFGYHQEAQPELEHTQDEIIHHGLKAGIAKLRTAAIWHGLGRGLTDVTYNSPECSLHVCVRVTRPGTRFTSLALTGVTASSHT